MLVWTLDEIALYTFVLSLRNGIAFKESSRLGN